MFGKITQSGMIGAMSYLHHMRGQMECGGFERGNPSTPGLQHYTLKSFSSGARQILMSRPYKLRLLHGPARCFVNTWALTCGSDDVHHDGRHCSSPETTWQAQQRVLVDARTHSNNGPSSTVNSRQQISHGLNTRIERPHVPSDSNVSSVVACTEHKARSTPNVSHRQADRP